MKLMWLTISACERGFVRVDCWNTSIVNYESEWCSSIIDWLPWVQVLDQLLLDFVDNRYVKQKCFQSISQYYWVSLWVLWWFLLAIYYLKRDLLVCWSRIWKIFVFFSLMKNVLSLLMNVIEVFVCTLWTLSWNPAYSTSEMESSVAILYYLAVRYWPKKHHFLTQLSHSYELLVICFCEQFFHGLSSN